MSIMCINALINKMFINVHKCIKSLKTKWLSTPVAQWLLEPLFYYYHQEANSLPKSAKHNRLGALHWRKVEWSDWKVRVRVGLDIGFMALDSIHIAISVLYTRELHVLNSKKWLGPCLLCSNFYLLCFWAVLKKVTHYAQCYACNYFNYATVQLQTLLF